MSLMQTPFRACAGWLASLQAAVHSAPGSLDAKEVILNLLGSPQRLQHDAIGACQTPSQASQASFTSS